MKKILFVVVMTAALHLHFAYGGDPVNNKPAKPAEDSLNHIVLEPWTYSEDFENRDLGAWASYPHWQDLAYDQNFRVNEMVPGDPNLSVVQKVTPYTHVDNYAGTQKLLDMFLVPESKLSFRYYLKTNLPAEYYKIRFAAGDYGAIDFTLKNPETNKWVPVTVSYEDIARENPALAGKSRVKIFALAFLAKVADADPAMPIYLGVDDIKLQSARAATFQFAAPAVYKLPEYEPYIPKEHYYPGDVFNLSGTWALKAKKVTVDIASYTDPGKILFQGQLKHQGDSWVLPPLKLSFGNGLYLGNIRAFDDSGELSATSFTLHIVPKNMAGQHPRLLFDAEGKKRVDERFKEARFKKVLDDIDRNAKIQRQRNPVDSLIFDLDQFPDENWLPTWSAWGSHIYNTAAALRWNSMAYAYHQDTVAGNYAKNVLVKLSQWPNWTHPWQTKRGRFSEHRTGSWSHRVAEAYDLTYALMTPEERTKIRTAVMKNIVEGVHKTYVDDDNITAKTSNWIGMTVGGSLMNMAAMFDDGPETKNLEPYFTGAMIKYYTFLNRVTDSKDGSWGEGLGYNTYTFSNLSYSVPSIKNVFNIDVSAPLRNTYNEFIWGGIIKKGEWFEFGDSGGDIGPATNWAFLLNTLKDPRLTWYYNYLKKDEQFEDVLYDTKGLKEDSPFDENPVKVFRKVGTTVFKSGWEGDDFAFVMRSGAFFNHQHLDQGSFWLADRGVTFIEERHLHNSDYYDDPLYQSHLIQPVGHSTILINKNEQSQRTGDDYEFAPGFNDHAFIDHFLDGRDAAFSTGDIGRLYWNKVKSLQRHVLFIKPRTLLMLDEAVPADKDARVTLQYQTARLEDIKAGPQASSITKEGKALNFLHLAPAQVETKAEETPHYLKTLLNVRPLKREGMLTVTSGTQGGPLILANMLTTTKPDEISHKTGEGYVTGTVSGKNFAFGTKPGSTYKIGNIETDALALTWTGSRYFVAMAKSFRDNGALVLRADVPVTFELLDDGIKYYTSTPCRLVIGAPARPASVLQNGKAIKNVTYDASAKSFSIEVAGGEGTITIKK